MPTPLNWNFIRKKKREKQERNMKSKKKAHWNQEKTWVNPKNTTCEFAKTFKNLMFLKWFCSLFSVIYLTLAQQISLRTQALNLWSQSPRGKEALHSQDLFAAHYPSPTQTASLSLPPPPTHLPSLAKQKQIAWR